MNVLYCGDLCKGVVGRALEFASFAWSRQEVYFGSQRPGKFSYLPKLALEPSFRRLIIVVTAPRIFVMMTNLQPPVRLQNLRLPHQAMAHRTHVHTRRLSLARPLRTLQEGSAECTGPATEKLRPFTRAVYVVEYEQGGALMREVTAAMNATNGRALGNVQGSLQAYQLTEEASEIAILFVVFVRA